jgi:2-keto-4-pentenoate hydratase/2-oxohepta-3-ene-1,7-dioic acid hydratase in catechol pathway
MIWCRYRVGDDVRFGLVEGDMVREVEGTPFDAHVVTTRTHKLDAVKLMTPVTPGTFYCAGVNYRDHVIKSAVKRGVAPVFPTRPDIGYRANSALIAHGENIVKPRDAGPAFQYEGELVAVFGKPARHVTREQALDCVLGWTIGNDVSERAWQASDRTLWRAKNCDTFKPMGPWIVTDLDPRDMTTNIRLNGELVDSFATGDMIFDAATYIAEVSKYITIQPGDVMWLGTDGLPRDMKPGDTVEIEITGIGVLRNAVVAEA